MRANHPMKKRQIQKKFRISYIIYEDTLERIDFDRPNNNDRRLPLNISDPHTISSPSQLQPSPPQADISPPPPPSAFSQSLSQNQTTTHVLPIPQVQTQNHLQIPDLQYQNQSNSQLLFDENYNDNDNYCSDEISSDFDLDIITNGSQFIF